MNVVDCNYQMIQLDSNLFDQNILEFPPRMDIVNDHDHSDTFKSTVNPDVRGLHARRPKNVRRVSFLDPYTISESELPNTESLQSDLDLQLKKVDQALMIVTFHR